MMRWVMGFMLLAVLYHGALHAAPDTGTPVTGEAKRLFLQTWGARLQSMRALHMVFTQEKHLRVLRRPLTAQGELWLKGETLRYVLTNTAGAIELELRVDPQAIKTYYPLLHTLEVIDGQGAQATPLSMPFLRLGPAELEQAYKVSLRLDADRHILQLIPRDAKAPLQEMRLVLHDFQPQELIQVEKNGTRITMQIAVFTINPDITAAQLTLHVPPGTKVTYPLR